MCGTVLDAVTCSDLSARKPSPGDFSICIKCTNLNKFNKDEELESVSDEEFYALKEDERQVINKARNLVKAAQENGFVSVEKSQRDKSLN